MGPRWQSSNRRSTLTHVSDRERDQVTVSGLHTIAARTWEPPIGEERDDVLARLRGIAGDRTDLLTRAAGIMLGLRPPDENDSAYRRYDGGAKLLLEVAGVPERDQRVQEWVPTGEARRTRWRLPVDRGGIA